MATDPKTGQPIFGHYHVGVSNVGSYQVSGWPFITGSDPVMRAGVEHKIEFPMVTKSITVIASGTFTDATADNLRVHFASTGSWGTAGAFYAQNHYIQIDDDEESITLNVKCKEMYISAVGESAKGYQLIAEMTNIPTGSMYVLTGAGVTK